MKNHTPREELAAHFETENLDLFSCDSCQFATSNLNIYQVFKEGGGHANQTNAAFCDFCASTMAGNAFQYPSQYRGSSEILQAIAYGVNAILAKIGGKP